MQQTSHNWKGLKLLDVVKHQNKRAGSEMLRIKLQPNSINKQEDTARLSNMYNCIPIYYINLKIEIFNDHKHH